MVGVVVVVGMCGPKGKNENAGRRRELRKTHYNEYPCYRKGTWRRVGEGGAEWAGLQSPLPPASTQITQLDIQSIIKYWLSIFYVLSSSWALMVVHFTFNHMQSILFMAINFIFPSPLLLSPVCEMGDKNYGNRKSCSLTAIANSCKGWMMESSRKK